MKWCADEGLAHSEDDARRLVHADALTAEDDPRGEFITVPCKLAASKGTSAQFSFPDRLAGPSALDTVRLGATALPGAGRRC